MFAWSLAWKLEDTEKVYFLWHLKITWTTSESNSNITTIEDGNNPNQEDKRAQAHYLWWDVKEQKIMKNLHIADALTIW